MGNIVKFAKPYSFEGTEYTEVDLSGMDKLTIQDMIDIQKSLANELASLAALEATTSFAQEMATKAPDTGQERDSASSLICQS